jgi:hypothetical protein
MKMMTPGESVAIKPRMGRKKRWHDVMGAKFPAGTFERIATLLGEKEDRTDFVRHAVEREIERRQMAAGRKKPKRRR